MTEYCKKSDIISDLEWLESQGCKELPLSEIRERIELLIKPADLEPVVHAHWEWFPVSETTRTLRCSHCHSGKMVSDEHPLCPWCGAIMDEEVLQMSENCANCKHHDVFWSGAGCNLLNGGERCKYEPNDETIIRELREKLVRYEKAEQEGRLVELPCRELLESRGERR